MRRKERRNFTLTILKLSLQISTIAHAFGTASPGLNAVATEDPG